MPEFDVYKPNNTKLAKGETIRTKTGDEYIFVSCTNPNRIFVISDINDHEGQELYPDGFNLHIGDTIDD